MKKIEKDGGKFKYNNGINENGEIQVYVRIQFVNLICDRRKGFISTIRFGHNITRQKMKKKEGNFGRKVKNY